MIFFQIYVLIASPLFYMYIALQSISFKLQLVSMVKRDNLDVFTLTPILYQPTNFIWIAFCWQFLITYISSVSLKLLPCYITGQWGEFALKKCCLMFKYTFLTFFVVFFIFISFFDKVSNFHNRILSNQKPEQVIRNCQWNFVSNLYYGKLRYFSELRQFLCCQ